MPFLEVSECNVCGCHDISAVCDLSEFPIILRPIPPEVASHLKDKNIPKKMPLRFGICRNCGHMILLLRPKDEILHELYDSFYLTYPSQLELGFATTDTDEFLASFSQHVEPQLPVKSRILEIGCFDGYILSHLADRGFEVYGCDPSDGAKIGQARGIPITRAFYSPNLFTDKYFEAVINRHLIEHMDDPGKFASSLRNVTRDSGYIIMETPNGEYYLERGLLDPFHPEHLSVFTPSSLARCLKKAGLFLEKMFSNSRNLTVICRLQAHKDYDETEIPKVAHLVNQAGLFYRRYEQYMLELDHLIKSIALQGKTIAVWGAGSSGVTSLTMSRTLAETASVIVDRDKRKHGLTFFNLDMEIMSPEYLTDHPVDYIIVCSQFGSEIIHDIRDKYHLRSTVVTLSPGIEIVP